MENTTQYCKSCDEDHPLTKEFWYFSTDKKTGKTKKQCRAAKSKQRAQYNTKNRDQILAKQRQKYHTNPDKAKAKRERNKERQREYMKQYRAKNKEQLAAANKEWRERNKSYIKQKQHEYYLQNREKFRENGLKTYHKHKDKITQKTRQRYWSEPEYKMRVNLRNRARCALKQNYRSGMALMELGCDIATLKEHLESQFYDHPITGEQMSWENNGRGGWHIDHKTPLSSAGNNLKDIRRLMHYTNLQPLWESDNLRKGDKYMEPVDLTEFLDKRFDNVITITDNLCNIDGLTVKNIPLEANQPGVKHDNSTLYFFEHELANKSEIVSSMIANRLGLSKKIYARKCDIKVLSPREANQFLTDNHLMGEFKSAKHVGLTHNDELVACMSFKKCGDGVDISRFAVQCGNAVVGGFSKLLNHVEKNWQPAFIQSFCNNRYSSGESYKRLGFELVSDTKSFVWSDGFMTYNRRLCRANMDERRLSEKQYAAELGWFKIYDLGHKKFIRYTDKNQSTK